MDSDWSKVESKSRPGKFYYYNKVTHESSWKPPRKSKGAKDAAVPASQSHPNTTSSKTGSTGSSNQLQVSKKENAVDVGNGSVQVFKTKISSKKSTISNADRVLGKVHLQTNNSNCMETAQPNVSPEEEAMETERWGEEDVIDMDVDMTEEEQLALITEIHTTRSHLPLAASVESLAEQRPADFTHTQKLYLVLDTNILISHLGFLRELKDYAIKSVGRPVLVVPWVVMQELDALKTSSKSRLADKARDAIQFLHDSFQSQHPRVRGQTMDEVQTELKNIAISNNDDRILHCCLLYQEKVKGRGGVVILFSNDVQLSSKAMVNQIRALNRKTLLSELRVLFKNGTPQTLTLAPSMQAQAYAPPSTPKITPVPRDVLEDLLCEAESAVGTALSAAIYKEMVEAYGDLWETIVVIKPPWKFKDTVKLIDKHWVAVFRTLLPNHVYHGSIPALMKHVSHRDRLILTISAVDGFLANSMHLLRAFAEVSGYDGVLPQSVSHLAALTDRLNKFKSLEPVSTSVPSYRHVTAPVHTPMSHVTTPVGHVITPMSHVTTPVGHVITPISHVTAPVHTPMSHVTSPVGHVITPVSRVTTPARHVTRSAPTSHVTTPVSQVTPPPALPLITSLLRPSCDEILDLFGAIPTTPLEQLKWTLDVILAISKHCHSRILLTLQNNPHSLSDKQEASVFLTQLAKLLQTITHAINKLLINSETTHQLIRELILSFQIFLHTTLLKDCPLSVDGFIQCVRDSSATVQQLLVEVLTSFSAIIGALQQLPHDLGL